MGDQGSAHPRHTIQVAAHRTGLTQDTLRAWERRYGAVHPGRSEGRQRLYSDADIDRLRLLAKLVAAGHRIGHVATLPIAELQSLVREDVPPAPVPPPDSGRQGAEAMVEALLAATRALDASGIDALLRRASLALGARDFLARVVAPLLARVGEAWREGDLSPAHEHLLTTRTRRLLVELLASTAPEPDGATLLATTPAGEQHELGILLAGLTAALAGWRVTYLGPDVPASDIASAADGIAAHAVALSLVNEDVTSGRAEVAALLGALPASTAVLLGGRSASRTAEGLGDPRVLVFESLDELAETLPRLG